VQWLSWDVLVTPKSHGSLEFRDMRLFNQALAHQGWRLITYPNSLCSKVPKAKYFSQGSILDMAPAGEASLMWRAIEYGIELLKLGVVHWIGDGESTHIWRDNWIPRPSGLKPAGSTRTCRLRRGS
jgi:hypothetical protein